jgi:hypothetical protein
MRTQLIIEIIDESYTREENWSTVVENHSTKKRYIR